MNIYLGCVVVLIAFPVWFVWLRHFHIGVGVMLEWREGKVIVISRLTNSPAGRAGIQKGHQILEINYMPMIFDTGEEWMKWSKKHPNILRGINGYRHTQASIQVGIGLKTDDNKLGDPPSNTSFGVRLTPELITTRIPYHPSPRKLSAHERSLVTESVSYCSKTGEYYMKQRVNSTALQSAFPY